MAEAIAEAVGVTAQDVSASLTEKVEVLSLGSSVYGADVDDAAKAFVNENAPNIGKIVNFSTAAMFAKEYCANH